MATWGYARVSTDAQRDNTSLPEQTERIRAWAQSRGLDLAEVITEVASGKDKTRPGLRRLCERLKSDDTVVVYALSRLSRSLVDADGLISEWQGRGVALYSVTEPVETASAMGRAMYRMVLVFAQAEREVIGERVAAGKRRNAEAGRCNGRPAPYGYRRGQPGERDFEVIPEEAEVVRELFRLYATGNYGTGKLKRLTGCPLSETGIAVVLANVFYTGRIKHGAVVRFNDHARLVTDRLYNKVQVTLAKRARAPRTRFFKVRENKEELVEIH